MMISRSLVASLLLFSASAAWADCLAPAWESRVALPPEGALHMTMVVDDFDGDAIADVVFIRSTSIVTDTPMFQRGLGNGFFAAPVAIHSGRWIRHAVAKDLDRDGKLDLLLLENHARLVFLAGKGDGTFAAPIVSTSSSLGDFFTVADLTRDDIEDVAAFSFTATGPGVVIFAGTGTGTFAETTRIPLAEPPYAIAAGDLDGDGANDIVSGAANAHIEVLFGNDDGTFDPAVRRENGSWATKIELADLEKDGDLDIVAVNFFDHLAVHRNRGGGTFDPVALCPATDPFTSTHRMIHATAADVTGDGTLDLLVTTSTTLATLRGLGDGTFAHPHFGLYLASGVAMAPVKTTDFDGDGRLDVIVGQNNVDGLRALRNRCGDANVVLTAAASTIAAGGSVTLQVAAHGYAHDSQPSLPAGGTVSILEGTTVLATGTLLNGVVSLTVSGLAPGAHKLVARYEGDTQYEPALSKRIVVRVTSATPAPPPPPPPRRRAAGR